MNRIPRQVLMSYLPRVTAFLAMPVTIKLLTSKLSLEEYGSYCLINNLANYLLFVAGMGLHRYMAREIPGAEEKRQYSVFARAITLEVAAYLFLLFLLICFISPLANILKITSYKTATMYFVAGYLFYLLYNESLRLFGFQKRFEVKTVLAAVEKPLLLAGLLCLLFLPFEFKLQNLLHIYISAYVILFLASVCFVKFKHIRKPQPGDVLGELSLIAPSLGTLFLIDLLFKTKDVLPRYFLSAFGNNETVGLYAFCDNAVRVVCALVTPVVFIVYPYLAEQFNISRKQHNTDSFNNFLRLLSASSALAIYSYCAVAMVVCFYRCDFVLLLSKEEYLAASELMPFFAVNYFIMLLINILHPVLILSCNIARFWLFYCLALLCNIIACYFLVQEMMLRGAVICTMLTSTAIGIFVMFLLADYLRKLLLWESFLRFGIYLLLITTTTILVRKYLCFGVLPKVIITLPLIGVIFIIMRRRDIAVLLASQHK